MNPLVILPTYNEKENLESFVREVFSVIKTHILIIDDNSPDGTGKIADKMAEENQLISVMHRKKKMGLGSAYRQGFQWALQKDFDAIIQMDSDFSHNPHELPKMIQALSDADLVLGSRYVDGGSIQNWPLYRQWVSAFGSFYARSILQINIRDLTGGFKIFKRKVLEAIDLEKILSDGYAFQIETSYRAVKKGFKIKEIPIIFKDRTRGESKISKKVVWEAIWMVWKLRFCATRCTV